MRRTPPWREKTPQEKPQVADMPLGVQKNAWTGVSGAIQSPKTPPASDVVPPEAPKTPPWRTLREVAADTGARIVYHEGTKVQVKVPIGKRGPSYPGYPRYPAGETVYTGVVDPDLIARFVTEEDRILMLVEAEVDKRFQTQLDKLKKRVDELEREVMSHEIGSRDDFGFR